MNRSSLHFTKNPSSYYTTFWFWTFWQKIALLKNIKEKINLVFGNHVTSREKAKHHILDSSAFLIVKYRFTLSRKCHQVKINLNLSWSAQLLELKNIFLWVNVRLSSPMSTRKFSLSFLTGLNKFVTNTTILSCCKYYYTQLSSSKYVRGTFPRWLPLSPIIQSESRPGTL